MVLSFARNAHVDPYLKHLPKNGSKITVGGYTMKSKWHRSPIRGQILNLARDFAPK
jgi:hypothetical protein